MHLLLAPSRRESQVILSLVGLSAFDIENIIAAFADRCYAFMLGDVLYSSEGSSIIARVKTKLAREQGRSVRIFADTRFHDTPFDAGLKTRAMVAAGADMLSGHATGTSTMLREMVKQRGTAEIFAVFASVMPHKQFAAWLDTCGVQGIICKPRDVETLVKHPEFGKLTIIADARTLDETEIVEGVAATRAKGGGTPTRSTANDALVITERNLELAPPEVLKLGAHFVIVRPKSRAIVSLPEEIETLLAACRTSRGGFLSLRPLLSMIGPS